MYKGGGLYSVTSKILVTDLLSERTLCALADETEKIVPVELITGIVVLHSETYVYRLNSSNHQGEARKLGGVCRAPLPEKEPSKSHACCSRLTSERLLQGLLGRAGNLRSWLVTAERHACQPQHE